MATPTVEHRAEAPRGARDSLTSLTSKDIEKHEEDKQGEDASSPKIPSNPAHSDKDESNRDPNLIEWDENDPENPQNWGRSARWAYTMMLGGVTFVVTFASSVFSTATVQTAEQFNVSTEVMTLGTSLFVLGFAFGPLVWGPFSEIFGRKTPMFTGYFIFAFFTIGVAVAQNLYTIMICRFFGGLFASAPLAVVVGCMVDMWDVLTRGIAIAIFAAATFAGPVMGPIIGGFVTESYLGWRWTQYITAIMAFFFGALGVLFVPETFGPVILQRKAKRIRHQTKNWAIHSQLDTVEINARQIAFKYLVRPFQMFFQEPILICITIYVSFVYGIIYLLFEAFPISYIEERGWTLGVSSLPFLSVTVGVFCGIALIVFHTKTRYQRRLLEEGSVPPEERLIPVIAGGFILPIGLFWFAWTSYPSLNPWPQIISGVPLGMGLMVIFLQSFNYMADTYLMYATSAIAANTFVRSWVGAGFPLFATAMFHNLGVRWAASTLGFISIAMLPIPILFYIYGPKIRKLSRFAPTL